jgi:hypothetical protein
LYKKVEAQTFSRVDGLQRYFIIDAADNSDDTPCIPRKVAGVVSERLVE